ncbi:exonuclease SbcCD subunit D [Cellulosilyticum sp. I15G10I2]|uniref:exonuclease SbcCD subunit D n=1 Tax=Cellulosilyticum sp. I15G10I2 TaxID=1892843 RepID=UPI00085BF205|nr:exonuclease SbcCD subunit D [Cellulosilyticum sp. I15G10I2]
MKIIHTGDWHIGKQVNGFHMTEDQAFVMEQVFEIIEEEKPEAFVIAGDLYDRSVPPIEAVELLNRALNKIVRDLNTPVIALAGNHDGNERLEFASELLTNSGLHIGGLIKRQCKKVVLQDGHGPVNFYLIPYAPPAVVRELFEDSAIKTHDDAMRKIIESIHEEMDVNERNVAVAHGYITYRSDKAKEECDLEFSDSEIGGIDLINASYFDRFNYTALGHLHGPQKVGSDKIRYSGSLLKYSFSEVNQKKGLTIVEVSEDGSVHVRLKAFKPKRDFRILKGKMDDLLKEEVYTLGNREDYIKVVLTDEGELIDPVAKIKGTYPYFMELQRENKIAREKATNIAADFRDKTRLELFNDFYKDMKGEECSDEARRLMEDIIHEIEREGDGL